MRTLRVAVLLIPALLALSAFSCRDLLGPERIELERAHARWEASGPDSYAYTFRPVCFCPAAPVEVVVRDGTVVTDGHTVDQLFDRLRAELSRDPHEARLDFHPDLGYPVDVFFDYERNVVDEEWGFRIDDFVPR